MTTRALSIQFRHVVHHSRFVQIGLIVLFWLVGEAVVRLTGVPLPGGVIGLAAVLALLASHRLQLGSVRRGAHALIAEMLLFFVPAVLAVLDHGELIGLLGLKVLAVIVVGTLAVMAVTAMTVEICQRFMRGDDHAGLLHT